MLESSNRKLVNKHIRELFGEILKALYFYFFIKSTSQYHIKSLREVYENFSCRLQIQCIAFRLKCF